MTHASEAAKEIDCNGMMNEREKERVKRIIQSAIDAETKGKDDEIKDRHYGEMTALQRITALQSRADLAEAELGRLKSAMKPFHKAFKVYNLYFGPPCFNNWQPSKVLHEAYHGDDLQQITFGHYIAIDKALTPPATTTEEKR